MFIIFGGLGIQGKAILNYLSKTTNETIVVCDIKPEMPENFKRLVKDRDKIIYIQVENIDSGDWVLNIYSKVEIKDVRRTTVISCLPTEFNLSITKLCINSGWDLVDLGGVTNVVLKQFELNKEAEKYGCTIVPDCGLAPGIVSSLAGEYCVKHSSFLRTIRAYCGGIPLFPKLPLGYAKTFHPAGVIKEYSGVAQEIRNGKVINVPALSGRESVFIPSLGVLEAVVTSGGLSISPSHLRVENFSYKTLRYPGHWDYIEKYIMSQPNPINVLESLLDNISVINKDIIVLMFDLRFHSYAPKSEIFYWEYDEELDISAMAQATGYVVGAVAKMIYEGKIKSGVIGMHEISANEIINQVRLLDPHQFTNQPIRYYNN